MEVEYLIESLPWTGPDGSKRVKVKASTYSSSGTPYCSPSETAIGKLLSSQRRALLVHVDEDFAQPPVVVFAGAQIDLMAADHGLLGIALAAVRHALALAHHHDALDHLLHHLLRECGGARGGRLLDESLDDVVLVLLVRDQLRLQWLRELGAVAVERIGLERELPGEQIRRLAVLDRGVVRHVDGLGDRPGDEGLRRGHHADVALDREVALAVAPAGSGAVEHRIVLGLEMGSALDRP